MPEKTNGRGGAHGQASRQVAVDAGGRVRPRRDRAHPRRRARRAVGQAGDRHRPGEGPPRRREAAAAAQDGQRADQAQREERQRPGRLAQEAVAGAVARRQGEARRTSRAPPRRTTRCRATPRRRRGSAAGQGPQGGGEEGRAGRGRVAASRDTHEGDEEQHDGQNGNAGCARRSARRRHGAEARHEAATTTRALPSGRARDDQDGGPPQDRGPRRRHPPGEGPPRRADRSTLESATAMVSGAVAAMIRLLPWARDEADPIALLEVDHRRFESLFEQGAATTPRAVKRRTELLAALTAELNVHELIEEKVLYPALASVKAARAIVLEGSQEHHVADVLLKELHRMPKSDERWGAKFKVLQESIEHHIEEEERRMFPIARGVLDREALHALGREDAGPAQGQRRLTSSGVPGSARASAGARRWDWRTGGYRSIPRMPCPLPPASILAALAASSSGRGAPAAAQVWPSAFAPHVIQRVEGGRSRGSRRPARRRLDPPAPRPPLRPRRRPGDAARTAVPRTTAATTKWRSRRAA